MNRCVPDSLAASFASLLRAALLAVAAGAGLLPAIAQTGGDDPNLNARTFPATALRGQLVINEPPLITLDGKPERLAPGARIRSVDNVDVLSGTLTGQRLTVNYTRDNLGQVHQVWVLSRDEARQKRPAPPRVRGPVDDGKTAYEDLPRY